MANVTFQKDGVDVVDLFLTPADFDANGLWHSDPVSTSNDTRVTANATFTDLTPDGSNVNVDYRLQTVLEGEEDVGVWGVLVRQLNPTFRSESAPTQRLIATTGPLNYEPGVPSVIPDALGNENILVSVEDVEIPDAIRVCVALADRNQGNPGLTSFKLTLRGVRI